MMQGTLTTAAMVDSLSRFIGNVGVPATIALFILYQITPRLDRIADQGAASSAQLTMVLATCGRPLPELQRPAVLEARTIH